MSSAIPCKQEAVVKAEADSEEVKIEQSVFVIDPEVKRKPDLATIRPLKVEIDPLQVITAEPGPSVARVVAEVRVNTPPPPPSKSRTPSPRPQEPDTRLLRRLPTAPSAGWSPGDTSPPGPASKSRLIRLGVSASLAHGGANPYSTQTALLRATKISKKIVYIALGAHKIPYLAQGPL